MSTSTGAASSDPITCKLSSLSEELKEILNNEDAFEKFMDELENPSMAVMDSNISAMEERIKSTAEGNIELQSEVEVKRNALLCKVEEYHQLKAALSSLTERLTNMKEEVSPNRLADQLLRLAVSHEEESEVIAEQFLDKNISMEDFLSSYIKSRELYHVNKIKAEKVKIV